MAGASVADLLQKPLKREDEVNPLPNPIIQEGVQRASNHRRARDEKDHDPSFAAFGDDHGVGRSRGTGS
jgi:hypothetical protein